jgi:flagellar basal-body rod protein FlgG
MNAQQLSIDNIANNLANANTVGFKSRRTEFQDLLYQSLLQPGSAASSQTTVPSGLQLGLGTRPAANSVIFSQGNFQQTDNPLDLVIQGKGFFQIKQPDGTVAYTRAGNFQLDKDGNLVSGAGNPLEPAINIPQQAMPFRLRRTAP